MSDEILNNGTPAAEENATAQQDEEKTARKKKTKSRPRVAQKGRYRTTTPFFILGLIACIPVAGLLILLHLRKNAVDQELKSVCEALVLLRPLVLTITLAVFTFLVLLAAKIAGVM